MEHIFGSLNAAKEAAISLRNEMIKVDGQGVDLCPLGPRVPDLTNSEQIALSLFWHESNLLRTCSEALNCRLFRKTGSLEEVTRWHQDISAGRVMI